MSSSSGVEIISIREVNFRSVNSLVEQCTNENRPLKIEQKFSFTLIDGKENQIGVQYLINGFLAEKVKSKSSNKKENSKNPLMKLVFGAEYFCCFDLPDMQDIEIAENTIKNIKPTLLRLLISVTVGSSRGILSLKSSSLPKNFLIPIIDLEDIENQNKNS